MTKARMPAAVIGAPIRIRLRRAWASGGRKPSRMASTGDTVPALRAGIKAATAVTISPISTPAAMEAVVTRRGLSGSEIAAASKAERIKDASPTPPSAPRLDATSEITKASASIRLRICVAVAPMARSTANSRVRWAIVTRKMFEMTNVPTNSATPANTSTKVRMNPMASWNPSTC